ncbi:MAG: amidoligase family protein [Deltaproteobacteria bacterium]|nr:amidoligase family protein [Deltaproteobacteria bacterium]MBW2070985.1 amidoligase family protein [Deltaproteobacteria bacterium]
MACSQQLDLHLKEKYPMLQFFTERPFGVEIETYGLNYVVTPLDGGMIKPYNIWSRAKDGRRLHQLCKDLTICLGSDRQSWHFEEDSSIVGRGGAELVSPVLRGLDGLIQVYHSLQFLAAIDRVKVNDSCGFHVHHGVDKDSYGCDQIRKLVSLVYPLEEQLYTLIPGERQNSATCRPMEIDIDRFLASCDNSCQNGNCRIKQLWYSPENRYEPEAPHRYDKTRYHGLNLHSYWYRSTIEFRYHSAVLADIDEAMQWIIFTQFLVELSSGFTPEIPYYAGANKWLRTIYRLYRRHGLTDLIAGS